MENKHEFAIFYADLAHILQHPYAEITDDQAVSRMRNVLRLEPGESLILFDDTHHCQVTIAAIKKSSIAIKINSVATSEQLQPSIRMLLPLLKREAMEQSLAAMCELGVTTIQPIITAKSQHSFDQKDMDRAYKIMRASAEQSKQFAIPNILPVCALEQALEQISQHAHKIFFDMHGAPLKLLLDQTNANDFVCLIGPEGDLTDEEKALAASAGFTSIKLTPTVLRSWQAAFLGVGILRSYY